MSVLLFSGYNQRAIIAFCRFAISHNIDFRIVAKKNDTIFISAYQSKVIAVREKDTLSIQEIIKYRDLMKKEIEFDRLIILPSTEYLNRFLVSNQAELENNSIIVPLVNQSLYERISDKYSFGELCAKFSINIPDEIEVTQEHYYPIVAKPKKYFGNNGKIYNPFILSDKKQLESFFKDNDKSNFYFQKFIGGKSYYLLFYFSLNHGYSVYSQENLIQQCNGKSIIAAKSSLIHKHEITNKIIEMFVELNFHGLVMIELKYYNDNFYMIEANPRLWGPLQLILDANMNLLHRFAFDYKLISNFSSLAYKAFEAYYWSGGIIQDQQKLNKVSFHNYNESQFFSEISTFAINDVYAREDTIQIYLKELKFENYE
jgi:predicted ATP-grasp superfamily ATP-dependent carboligase